MTVKDVARQLDVQPATVHSWIQAGYLVPTNPRKRGQGRAPRYLISQQALDAYLDWREGPDAPKPGRPKSDA